MYNGINIYSYSKSPRWIPSHLSANKISKAKIHNILRVANHVLPSTVCITTSRLTTQTGVKTTTQLASHPRVVVVAFASILAQISMGPRSISIIATRTMRNNLLLSKSEALARLYTNVFISNPPLPLTLLPPTMLQYILPPSTPNTSYALLLRGSESASYASLIWTKLYSI